MKVAQHVVAEERGTSGSAKHQVVVHSVDGSETIFTLARLVLAQFRDSFGGQRDGAASATSAPRTVESGA